jgi:hypothetical protein
MWFRRGWCNKSTRSYQETDCQCWGTLTWLRWLLGFSKRIKPDASVMGGLELCVEDPDEEFGSHWDKSDRCGGDGEGGDGDGVVQS